MKSQDLHVVGVYSNPRRYAVRPRLLRQWVSDTLDSGVTLYVVQHAFGERPYEFSNDDPGFQHVSLINVRGGAEQELWLQHALYNRGLAAVPEAAKWLCWQDTDLRHLRSDWAVETIHMLQHNRVGQTWSRSIDVDPKGNITPNEWGNEVDRSFCAAWLAGDVKMPTGNYAPAFCTALMEKHEIKDWRSHTGYSWAIRRETLTQIGRLLDWLIAGSADWHMALGFAGLLRAMVETEIANGGEKRYSVGYYRRLREFAILCEKWVKQDIGCADGTVVTGWHGSKAKRYYGARESILTESKFDPDRDIAYDVNGLPTLCSDNRLLREGLRRYNMMQNSDSIDP